MKTLLNSELDNGVIALIDEMPMRRAEIAAFLADWAVQARMRVTLRDLSAQDDFTSGGASIRMMIVSVGGDTLSRSRALPFIISQGKAGHDIPVVVLSDRSARREIELAFQAGAQGYIPSTTEPGLALQALTFILNGGHYFPSVAL
ncbi:MAG TPA: hypothetical protein VL133_10915 [Devosia sp.]|nr:hypothetical protein [Devosia sp.]